MLKDKCSVIFIGFPLSYQIINEILHKLSRHEPSHDNNIDTHADDYWCWKGIALIGANQFNPVAAPWVNATDALRRPERATYKQKRKPLNIKEKQIINR